MPTKGSMVEYLPVGSQEAPQTIIAKKNFKLWNPKLHSQPSVQCIILNGAALTNSYQISIGFFYDSKKVHFNFKY